MHMLSHERIIKFIDSGTGEWVGDQLVSSQVKQSSEETKSSKETKSSEETKSSGLINSSKKFNYIILELAQKGDLFTFLKKEGGQIESEARRLAKQFLEALKYMHVNGVCHRDLKPENILLDEMHNIKIADLGMAARIEP